MSDNPMADVTLPLLFLRLRSAIADKEWMIACANMETAQSGRWTCAWDKEMHASHVEILALIAQIEKAEGGAARHTMDQGCRRACRWRASGDV